MYAKRLSPEALPEPQKRQQKLAKGALGGLCLFWQLGGGVASGQSPFCRAVWLTPPGTYSLMPDTVYGLAPGGWEVQAGPDTAAFWLRPRLCSLDTAAQFVVLPPYASYPLPSTDTLYVWPLTGLSVNSPPGFDDRPRFCVYVLQRQCSPAGEWQPPLPALMDNLENSWPGPLLKKCLCVSPTCPDTCKGLETKIENRCDSLAACTNSDTIRVCRSSGVFPGFAVYLPVRPAPGQTCATWWHGCRRAAVYHNGSLWGSCVFHPYDYGPGNLPPPLACDSTHQYCNSPLILGWDRAYRRQFFWLGECPPPGRYQIWTTGPGYQTVPDSAPSTPPNGPYGPILEVVNTGVAWQGALPDTLCGDTTFTACVVVSGAPYVAGYTWQIGASSVYVPSGALASTDTAVVCTTFTLPSAGSFSLSFSVQYNSSVYCAGCCEPAAFRQAGQGCQSCFSVHHTFTIGAPSCVLTALPETVCVGQPVIFQLNLSPGCLAAAGNYLWNFGDGQAGTTSTPSASHTYAAPGSYTVSVCPIRARTREGASPPPCICRPSFQVQVVAPPQLTLQGPPQMCWDTTAQRFVLGGLQPGDQVVWTLSCSGSPTYTLSPSQDTLTVLDWGGSRLCVLEAEVRRGPCQSRIRRSIPKGSLIATLQGTSPTTCRAADYWVSPLPPATQLRWLLPSGITYTLIGNPSTPMLQVQDWGPYTSRGFLLCAEVLGAAGCRETLCLSLAPCCIDSTARTYTRPITVSQILRDYGPDAFLCQTYYINDTLYVDTSIAWVNCQFFFGPYGLVWIKDDQTLTLETPPASCERCQGRGPTWCRLEPCQKRWKGIYAAGYKARVVIRGVFSPPAALQPVWIIAADTGVAATAPASWDISGALFNKCGVGLYWRAPLSSYTTALQQCKTQKALFLQVDTAFVVQSGRPCPYVDISTRQKWPLRRPPVTQDPSTGRVQATVGIWVVSGDSLALNDSVLIFRGLHYGLVGEASTLAARLNRYERLDPEPCFIKDSLRAALRIQALSLYDKTFPLRCPQPFLCPPGTAICSQGEELHARRHLTVLQSRFDSVHIGIQAWGGTTRYPYVRFPLPLTLISQCRLSYGEIGISLIDIGLLDPLHLRLSRIQISQNTLTAYRRGIEILRSHDMEGTLQQNILTAPSRAPLQGIWISERVVSLGPQKTPPKLLLQANQILGYREGVLASSSQGDIEMRQNSIQVAPLPGASGVNIPYPTGFSYLLCSNTLSALAPFALPNPCLPQNPAAVRALAFSLTRLNLYCNTSSLLPWGYHFSGPLPTPHDLRRNVLNHPYLHFFNENSNAPLQVGDPLQASSSIYLPIPLQVSTGGLVQIHERPPVQLVPVCAPGGGGGSAVRPSPPCFGVRGLCERVVPPPPPPPFPGVAARLQHPYPRWAAFRSLLSTPDSLWTNDPAWQSFFTAEQSTPAGQLEIAYQAWRAGDPLALPLSQSLPASPPTETAFQEALSYLEKAERNSLLPAEVERLWELAGSCPDSVGPAAFLAREILRWLGADTSFVEEPCPDTPYRLLPPTDTLPEEREREAERPYLFDRVAEPLILHPTPSSPNPLDTTPPTPTPMYLHILPNPAEYSVTLYYGELPHPESSLEIYDSQGRRLYQKSLTGREGYEKLNVVHWPRGLYQVLLRSGKTIRKETLWIYP